MSQRIDRVDELLRHEIGSILEREVRDPRIGFVTVTRVETSPDLAHARVWVSIIGTPAEREASLRALGHAMPYVRRELGSRIRIRRIPALHVHLDESIERGARVLELIDKVSAGTAGDPLEPVADGKPAESLPTPTRRRAQDGDASEEALDPDATGAADVDGEAGSSGSATKAAKHGARRSAPGASKGARGPAKGKSAGGKGARRDAGRRP